MGTNHSEIFIFPFLPADETQLMQLPEADLDSPYKTVGLTMLALLQYEKDPETCFKMLDALRGPEPMTPYAKSFLKDRLSGKGYKVRSFFMGATPENNYTPGAPCAITISENPTSFSEENWGTLYVQSSGADAPRPIKVRKKPSTGQWFLNDIQCLSDIRQPAASDPWA